MPELPPYTRPAFNWLLCLEEGLWGFLGEGKGFAPGWPQSRAATGLDIARNNPALAQAPSGPIPPGWYIVGQMDREERMDLQPANAAICHGRTGFTLVPELRAERTNYQHYCEVVLARPALAAVRPGDKLLVLANLKEASPRYVGP